MNAHDRFFREAERRRQYMARRRQPHWPRIAAAAVILGQLFLLIVLAALVARGGSL